MVNFSTFIDETPFMDRKLAEVVMIFRNALKNTDHERWVGKWTSHF